MAGQKIAEDIGNRNRDGSGSGPVIKTLNSLHAASQSVSAGLRKTSAALSQGGFKSQAGRGTLEKLLRDYADRLDNAI